MKKGKNIRCSHQVKVLISYSILYIHIAEKISGWALEKLYTIIENRNENRLPIIITTRFDKQGLIERFSQSQDAQLVDAIISKLYQMCYGITLKSMKKELVKVGKTYNTNPNDYTNIVI